MNRPRGFFNHKGSGTLHWIFLTTLILWVKKVELKFEICKRVGDILDCSFQNYKIQSFDFLNNYNEEVTKINLTSTEFSSFSVIGEKFTEIYASHCNLKRRTDLSMLGEQIEVLHLSGNSIRLNNGVLKNLTNLKELKLKNTPLPSLEYLPSPCSLLYLDVSSTRIKKWKGIEECKQLEWLDVSWNELNFSDETFPELEKLQHLVIQGYFIKDFPTDALRKCPNLAELDISDTDIIPKKEDFASVPNLRSLTMEPRSFPPDIFSELSSLTELHLVRKRSRISSITEGMIITMINLEILDMKYCRLSNISIHELSKLTKLRKLDLSKDYVMSIPETTFSEMHDMEWISLESNGLSVLESNTFRGLSKLKHLDLGFNDISKLPTNVFSSLSNLKFLSLEKNKIKILQDDSEIFYGLQNLEILKFRVDDNTTELPNAIFNDLQNLKFLFVEAPGLTVLHAETFSELKKLEELYIRQAKINFESKIFQDLVSLKILDLSRSHLTELPEGLLKGLDNLEVFKASFCGLEHIPDNIFSGCGRLKTVNLLENHFTEIPTSALAKCPSLERLGMSNNDISSLPDFDAEDFPNLWRVVLTNNNIGKVPREKLMTWLPTGRRLELELQNNDVTSPKSYSWVLEEEEITFPLNGTYGFVMQRDEAFISISFFPMMCGDKKCDHNKSWMEIAKE